MRNCSSCFRANDVTGATSNDVNFTVYNTSGGCLRGKSRTNFYCCGPPKHLESFEKRHGMTNTGKRRDFLELELAQEACETETFEEKIVEPVVPYIDKIPVDLHLGSSLEILGKTFTNCNRFSINLSTGKGNDADIALHFNPRLDRRIVVRNHRIGSKWGLEEIVSIQPFPLKQGKNFSVLIFIADEHFMIAINKVHFCAFSFRIPLSNITHLVITGDIILNLLKYELRTSYPPMIFSKTPYIIVPKSSNKSENKCDIRRKVHAIHTGTKIEIFGRLKLLPRGFYINLQEGLHLWPHPLIAFHMNLRLNHPGMSKTEYEIIFNSWLNGYWEKETAIKLCPFLPGHNFHIVIDCSPTCYIVEVNNKFLYKHQRMEKFKVDCLLIFGDVIISKVVLRRSIPQNNPIDNNETFPDFNAVGDLSVFSYPTSDSV